MVPLRDAPATACRAVSQFPGCPVIRCLQNFLFSNSTSCIDAGVWEQACFESTLLSLLTEPERVHVRKLSTEFLAQHRVVGVPGFEPAAMLITLIAAEACVLVAKMPHGVDAYRHARDVVVYPSSFVAKQCWVDEDGVEHRSSAVLSGEAWEQGVVVLAADDVLRPAPTFNVVVHEFAHILDAGNGAVNGFPPVSDSRLRQQWPLVFRQAWDGLVAMLERGESTPVDDYAATDPAEFFAVCVEGFFTNPVTLHDHWPELYALLVSYFGQDLRSRFAVA